MGGVECVPLKAYWGTWWQNVTMMPYIAFIYSNPEMAFNMYFHISFYDNINISDFTMLRYIYIYIYIYIFYVLLRIFK